MTDCGGLLVFEELLTAVHLHFNTVFLNLLMQFASQLCCHLIPSAIQTNSKKPSSFNHFNCHEILVFINHLWIFTIRHWPLQLLSKLLLVASRKVFGRSTWNSKWQGKVHLGSDKMFTSLKCLLSRLHLLFLEKLLKRISGKEIPER